MALENICKTCNGHNFNHKFSNGEDWENTHWLYSTFHRCGLSQLMTISGMQTFQLEMEVKRNLVLLQIPVLVTAAVVTCVGHNHLPHVTELMTAPYHAV